MAFRKIHAVVDFPVDRNHLSVDQIVYIPVRLVVVQKDSTRKKSRADHILHVVDQIVYIPVRLVVVQMDFQTWQFRFGQIRLVVVRLILPDGQMAQARSPDLYTSHFGRDGNVSSFFAHNHSLMAP